MEFYCRGAGCAEQGNRTGRGLRQAQGEETCAAFVQVDECLDAGVGVDGQRERRGTGAGGKTDGPQTSADEGVNHCFGKEQIRVGFGCASHYRPRFPARLVTIG